MNVNLNTEYLNLNNIPQDMRFFRPLGHLGDGAGSYDFDFCMADSQLYDEVMDQMVENMNIEDVDPTEVAKRNEMLARNAGVDFSYLDILRKESGITV